MIGLFIDNLPLDIDRETKASVTLGIGSIEEPEKSLTAFTKTIDVPATAHNREIMGHADDIHALEQFNNARHTARIEVDGVVVMTGVAELTSVMLTEGLGATYKLNLIGEEYRWASGATDTKLNATEGVFAPGVFSPGAVTELLQQNSGFFLLPVNRGKFVQQVGEEAFLDRGYTVLADYVPFYKIRFLTETIFRQWGYSIRSDFFASNQLFNNLIIAGAWKEYDTSKLEEEYDFLAGRLIAKEIVLAVKRDRYSVGFNELGPIVAVATPQEETDESDANDELHDNGQCVSFPDDSEPVFTAPEDMVLGLQYDLEYTPVVSIVNDNTLPSCKGKLFYFDTLNGRKLPDSCFDIDRKDVSGNLPPGSYLYIYSVSGGVNLLETLYIRFKKKDGTYDEPYVRLDKMFGYGYYGGFSMNLSATCKAEVWRKATGENEWKPTNRTVGIYVVDEQPTARVRYITEPKMLRKGEQLKIATPTFTCSEAPNLPEGFELTLSMGISIRTQVKAFFYKYPSGGETLSFANTLSSELTQMDFIKAVKQLFDLMFYTNADTKEVFIEPRRTFYRDVVVDWSDRMDYSEEIEIEDAGTDIGKTVILGYQTDDVIDAYNKRTQSELGTYKVDLLKYHASGETDLSNPQFVATTVAGNIIPGNPDITLIDLASEEQDDCDPWELELSDSMKVCEYKGLQSLPSGQQLRVEGSIPATLSSYPQVSFDNLHFDGGNGLKSYYQQTIESYNSGKRITASVKLSPVDVEGVMLPNELARDFRALYKIKIGAEDVYCRLEEIKDYNPASAEATKCVFVKG